MCSKNLSFVDFEPEELALESFPVRSLALT